MRGFVRIVAINVFAVLLCGCASHEVVPSSGPRPPGEPARVKIYQEHPKRYEQLRTLTLVLAPEMRWDEHGDANAVFDALKAQAAGAGANGLLLIANPADFELLATAGYHGVFYQVPMRRTPKSVVAQAVFVLEE